MISLRLPFAATLVLALPASAAPRLTGKLVGHFPAGSQPTSVRLIDDGSRLLVANRGDSSIAVYDSATMKVEKTYPIESVGHGVWDVALDPGTGDLLIANWMGEELRLVDRATGKQTGSIPVGIKPSYVAVTPDGARAYVAGYFSGNVSLVDLASRRLIRKLDVGQKPMGVAVSPDGRWLYVAACSSRKISKVDLKHEVVLETFGAPLAETTNLVITPDGRTLVAAGDDDRIVIVDTATGHSRNVRVGDDPAAVALTPDGATVLVAHYKGASVGLVDLASESHYATLDAGPGTIAVATDGRRVWACNDQAGSVSVHELVPVDAIALPAAAALLPIPAR